MAKYLLVTALAGVLAASAAQATPVLLQTYTHDYGSGPGRFNPPGNDALNPTNVVVSDQSSDRFSDGFDFSSLVYDTIDRFELTLTFANAGPSGFLSPCGFVSISDPECWRVRVQGATPAASSDDYFATLYSSVAPQTFTISAATDTGSITAFAQSLASELFSFWFSEESFGSDSFLLSSAELQVYGTPAAVPLPATGLALAGALAGLALFRRRKQAA